MPEAEGASAQELIEALDRFSDKTDLLLRNNATSTNNVNLAAGGIGAWVSALCSIVSIIVLCVVMGQSNTRTVEHAIKVAEQDRKIERMQDHLNAIYMMAPHLNPTENHDEE